MFVFPVGELLGQQVNEIMEREKGVEFRRRHDIPYAGVPDFIDLGVYEVQDQAMPVQEKILETMKETAGHEVPLILLPFVFVYEWLF